MKAKLKILALISLLIVLFLYYKKYKQKESLNMYFYPSGNLMQLFVPCNDNNQKYNICFNFYENGEIKSILRHSPYESKESLFFSSNGVLTSKIRFANLVKSGTSYYFYDTTGGLRSIRFYRHNKEALDGWDFWDDTLPVLKAAYYFNDEGQAYYIKHNDKHGNFLYDEGKK